MRLSFSTSGLAALLTAASLTLMLGASARAAEPRPVPSASVQRADGSSFEFASLAVAGPWVIVGVAAESPTTVRLLQAFETWKLGMAPGQVVLLVDGSPAAVGRLEAAWREKLPGIQFVADDRGAARRALQVRAFPTVLGARSGMVEWQVAGVLNDPSMLRAVIASWLSAPTTP